MSSPAFVSYLRVSTARQGRSGLGLKAQRRAVADFLNGGSWLRQIAAALNARGIPAARGGAWSATQVRRVQAPVPTEIITETPKKRGRKKGA